MSSRLWVALAIFSESVAWAQSPGQNPPGWMQFVPLVFMLGIFYFLLIRPQSKKQKVHQEFLKGLKRGDDVVTSSGILGRIEGMTDSVITLEVADGVRMKFLRSQIQSTVHSVLQGSGAKQ